MGIESTLMMGIESAFLAPLHRLQACSVWPSVVRTDDDHEDTHRETLWFYFV